MMIYGLSRKQCGVIFANVKKGNLNLPEGFCNWMYNRVADAKVFADNSKMADVLNRMKAGLDAVFAGNMDEAEKELTRAFDAWHVFYKEA